MDGDGVAADAGFAVAAIFAAAAPSASAAAAGWDHHAPLECLRDPAGTHYPRDV